MVDKLIGTLTTLIALIIVVWGTIGTKSIFIPILGMPAVIALAYCTWLGKRKC